MIPALIVAGGALLRGASIAATVAPLVKPALKLGGKLIKGTARPGAGSKVTKGPLMLGKQRLMGPARPGVGTALRVGAGAAAAVGIGTVASHRRATRPAPQTRPQPTRSSPTRTRTSERKCCPAGTKRMVCYKRGRVKARLGSKASKWRRKPTKQRTYRSVKRRKTARRTRRRR